MIRKIHHIVKRQKCIAISALIIISLVPLIFPLDSVIAYPSSSEVRITPSTLTISPGESFTVDVYVEPGEPIMGVAFDLSFDSSLVHADSVTEGDLFVPYNTIFNSGNIDNVKGVISSVYGLIIGAYNVTDPGVFCTISFTAQENTGTSVLDLYNVQATNALGDYVTDLLVIDSNIVVKESDSASELHIAPLTTTVLPGESFTVDVYVEPGEPIIGVAFDLFYDSSLVHANLVTEGDLFDPYNTIFNAGNIDNEAGTITNVYGFTVPATDSVTDSGTFCTISFTAQDATGFSNLGLYNVQVTNATGDYATVNVYNGSVTIEEEDDSGDGDEEPPILPPTNQDPIADANGPYYEVVDVPITFDGSGSSDSDGEIVSFDWDFGDGNIKTGMSPIHTYKENGNYTVKLTVTDDGGKTDTDTTYALVTGKPNSPPNKPELNGTTSGSKEIDYMYTVFSTDLDNNTIQYVFDWDDGTNTVSDFLDNGIVYITTHNWSLAGVYSIKVYAMDQNNATSETTELMIFIDVYVHFIDDVIKGYLIDYEMDGTYDTFHNNETGNETALEAQDNGVYLIDSDENSIWDYSYDPVAGTITALEKEEKEREEVDYTLFYVLGILILLVIILAIVAYTKVKKTGKPRKKKKEAKEKPKK